MYMKKDIRLSFSATTFIQIENHYYSFQSQLLVNPLVVAVAVGGDVTLILSVGGGGAGGQNCTHTNMYSHNYQKINMCVTVASVVFCTRIAANPQRLLQKILYKKHNQRKSRESSSSTNTNKQLSFFVNRIKGFPNNQSLKRVQ